MMLLGLILDTLIGWPRGLYNTLGHPVTWTGALIDRLDAVWNTGTAEQRRRAGAIATCIVIAATSVPVLILTLIFPSGPLGILLGGFLAWPMIAARSLLTHVAAVATPLTSGDTQAARHAVAQIVGRDPAQLDAPGIARASLESLAENTSDGVIAPLFWGVILGPPGLWAYKAINTLDSMIGHLTPEHSDFGRFAARVDDVVNLIPARLSGLLFAAVSGNPKQSLTTMRRDARQHRSPNAGWPESAMAGALGVRLSGPRRYADRIADEPWLNPGARDPGAQDIRRGLALYRRAMILTAGLLAALAVL
ncbi:MAG: adenosylcobinamide-phosphate synthase CbiB [Pseudomonadota bacterium]